jgi:ribosomal protein S18 acetylase RimI-like enzyme
VGASIIELLANGDTTRVTFIAKSLGTMVLSVLDPSLVGDRRTDAIWVTPIFGTDYVRQAASTKTWPSLLIAGGADEYHSPAGHRAVVEATGARSLVIPDADHSLEIDGDVLATVHGLDRVGSAVLRFLGEAHQAPQPGHVVISAATADDLSGVLYLARQWAASGETPGEDAEDQEWFMSHLGSLFLVARYGSELIGYAVGESCIAGPSVSTALVPGTPFLEVVSIYVRPTHRSSGVGSQLLKALLTAGQAAGLERSMLYTGSGDVDAASRFYSRHGFRSWGIQMIRD